MGYTCNICNTFHEELPLCFGAEAPWRELVSSEAEFSNRVELTNDQCVVDEKYFFVRGHIEIPVLDLNEAFCWSVWSSLSEESFCQMTTRWDDENRENEPPYFGWLCTNLPCYNESSLNLKLSVQTQSIGNVPQINILEPKHELYFEQNNGVSISRIERIIHELMHKNG